MLTTLIGDAAAYFDSRIRNLRQYEAPKWLRATPSDQRVLSTPELTNDSKVWDTCWPPAAEAGDFGETESGFRRNIKRLCAENAASHDLFNGIVARDICLEFAGADLARAYSFLE